MNILDLPDEILLNIIKKLNMIDVLYSLVDVNQRFDRLVLDPFYTNHLDLTVKALLNDNFSIEKQVLSRICKEILPRINNKIKKLTVNQYSMEDILGAVVYPQLYSLSLINFESDTLLPYLRDDTKLRCLLTNQITHVNIKMIDKKPTVRDENESNLFALILSRSKRLTDLTYSQWFCSGNSLISMYNLPSTSCVCSTLTKLNIDVNHFDDCLYFLDGRFDSLSTLIIYIETISSPLSNIDNTRQLPKLKCLSLITYCRTQFYDSLVVPLICRMSNLEELTLYLSIQRIESTYIDGNHLYNEILIHMPQLKKFIFSINTLVINKNIRINLPSNNDIQRSFIEREYQQIASYTHKESIEQRSTCHIYSLPYQFDRFYNMNCHFQGGIFNKVRMVMMTDRKHPFEQEFFQIVSNCFPFLQKLTIWNYQPQKRKQQLCPIITFPYLHCLILRSVNVDYADQFLNDTKIHLPCLLELRITYESLVMITYNFTNDATRLTCARLRILIIYGSYVRPENFHTYFPLCNM
ncbi:unnamed protein product [Rotaria sordida]|uniref:F-box domain-containing protein n=1 Tax=Rotaria sordida TaxID=392033 RepID=A0A813NSQ5_9BILA|nr:unnamed protein product [Rotaria sordida]CAF1072564.1 unnamed protein product [Rotaria sordida]